MNKMINKIINKHKKLFIGVVVLIIIYSLLSVLSGYSLSFMVNIFDKDNTTIKDVFKVIFVILFIDIMSLTSLYTKYYYQSKLQSRLRNEVRLELSNKIIHQDYENFIKRDSGTYLAWFTNDIKEIDNRCFEGVFNIIHSITSVIGTFIAIATFNIWISVTTTVLSITMVFLPKLMNNTIQKIGEKHTKEEESYISKVKSLIEGFPDLYVSNSEDYFDARLKQYSNVYELNYFQFLIIQLKTAVYSAGLSSFSQLCLLGLTMIFVSLGKAPIGSILAMAGLGQVFMGGISGIVNSLISIKSSNVFFKKYENIEKRALNQNKFIELNDKFKIETKDLCFSYNDNSEKLNFPDLDINNFNKTLIKGANGSGKSTLLHLILGLYKVNSGIVNIDDNNVSVITKEEIFNKIAYMQQSPKLFIDTIRNNIKLNLDVNDSQIWEVLATLGLVEFVKGLPGQLDYKITDQGKNLSGGQKQRFILARHLLRDVDTIVLDEATSNIDIESKLFLYEKLLNKNDRGVIMVDHSINKENESLFDDLIIIK
ncbi:ABC transporter ATP-binding protein [Helcococcus bovis]|uniref:ATP-binding cassette domain-containing protein n=1 Tax=Helcococcus bovis TaxID=3153252 RepID=UPI0038B9DD10